MIAQPHALDIPAVGIPTAVQPTCSLAVFKALCEARAYLVAIGETEMLDAVDLLQELAENGPVQQIGQDAVQAIMATAFQLVEAAHDDAEISEPREWIEPPEAPLVPIWEFPDHKPAWQRDVDQSRQERTERGPATSTIDAFKYVVSLRDPAHLRRWLARRSSAERQQLKQMVALR